MILKLKNALWLWGQDAGSHHVTTTGNFWNLPGANKMNPAEGLKYFGIPNCCRVVMNGKPEPPFDRDTEALKDARSVVWSFIGDGGSRRNDSDTDLEEVVRMARRYPNVSGAIMDDFMRPDRMAIFDPNRVAEFKQRLHTAILGKPLDFWTVLYTHEIAENILPYLEQVDIVSLWTWDGRDLVNLKENFAKLMAMTDKSLYAGCYFYDYVGCRELPMDLMRFQMDVYHEWLMERKIKGIIFCSNAVADIGLKTADYAREWIAQHGEEEIPEL